ncbi:MAG: hypothetical protein ACI9XC_001980 [Gammaproteobacteria bacterium]|jgi:hypothetical protein
MKIRMLILSTLAFAFCMATGVNAQGTSEEARNRAAIESYKAQEARTEQVGPTMFRVRPTDTPYEHWFAANKDSMPAFEGVVIQDARTYPLAPWDRFGVDGMYIKMADYQITDGWILEIPPKGEIKPQRHVYEAGLYFFGGPGHIILQQEGRRPQRIDYGHRALYSIPNNVRYQIFNDSDEVVRIVAVTSFPFLMNAMNNEDFIYKNDFAFTDRYDAEEDYGTYSEHTGDNDTVTNFVPDALEFELDAYDHRGKGTTNMHWKMSGNSIIDMHVSEMPGGLYKKAHRHSSDAFILLTSGNGYSLTWPEGRYEDRIRVDWNEGTIFVPPIYWYHQHMNPDPNPENSARYLAINAPPIVVSLGLRFNDQLEVDVPEMEAEFKAEVAKRKAAAGM